MPLGVTIRELLEDKAGGMQDGLGLKAFYLVVARPTLCCLSTSTSHSITMKSPRRGSRLATGTMIVLDDQTCPVGMIGNLMKFFAHESCGFCTPVATGCRGWMQYSGFRSGAGSEKDLNILKEQVEYMGPGRTFCALAPGATAPLGAVSSTLRMTSKNTLSKSVVPTKTEFWGLELS